MRWMGWGCWISRCIRQGLRRPEASAALGAAREERAQATVEAAVLLPVFLTLLLLAVQPVCVLYARAVMESAAAETARLMVTAEGETDESIRAFALRRLAAVPDISIFHAGGPLAWDIEMQTASSGDGEVMVCITGAITPLPVIGAFAHAFGAPQQGDGLLYRFFPVAQVGAEA